MDGALTRRGLSLAELILALGLFVTAALLVFSLLFSSLKMNRQGEQITEGTQLARQLLETVKQKGYSQIAVGTYDGRLGTPVDAATGFPPAPYPTRGRYQFQVQARQVTVGVVSVQVEVYWASGGPLRFYTLIHQ